MRACVPAHARRVCMYIIMSKKGRMVFNCLQLLKIKYKQNFFREIFGSFENSLYFCTRFWEIKHYSKQYKKEFFERFYINRQVVQEAVLDYTLLYRAYEETG